MKKTIPALLVLCLLAFMSCKNDKPTSIIDTIDEPDTTVIVDPTTPTDDPYNPAVNGDTLILVYPGSTLNDPNKFYVLLRIKGSSEEKCFWKPIVGDDSKVATPKDIEIWMTESTDDAILLPGASIAAAAQYKDLCVTYTKDYGFGSEDGKTFDTGFYIAWDKMCGSLTTGNVIIDIYSVIIYDKDVEVTSIVGTPAHPLWMKKNNLECIIPNGAYNSEIHTNKALFTLDYNYDILSYDENFTVHFDGFVLK